MQYGPERQPQSPVFFISYESFGKQFFNASKEVVSNDNKQLQQPFLKNMRVI